MSRAGLQREPIVRHALEVADAEGLDAVSFRRLAADFGVTPMALYRHLADRNDLLIAMTDLVLGEIQLPDDSVGDWVHSLREVIGSAAAAYSRHPAARALSSAGRWSATSLTLTESLIRLLAGAGFTEREALVIVQRLNDAVLAESWALSAQPMPQLPGLEAALRQTAPEDPRAFGIDLVIAGAQAMAARGHRGRQASSKRSRPVPGGS